MKRHWLNKAPFFVLVLFCLISGISTGWFRLGYDVPVSKIYLNHGAIMTGSFLGTVILIERIVTFQKNWLFVFPAINAFSILFFYLGWGQFALYCLVVGALGLVYVFYLINLKQSDLAHQVMWIGAAMWLIGNVHLLIFQMYANSILWWMGFLLLTIVGERLELTRFLPLSRLIRSFLVLFLVLFVISYMLPFHFGGQWLTGISLCLTALWLLLFDMIRKSVKKPGIHRFTAVTLGCGYVWLVVSGLCYLMDAMWGVSYDALIHTFFLGFVFSMIFAHAPIILPGVLGQASKPYHSILYIWVGIFQLSLVVRILGDFLSFFYWKQLGGIINGVVILIFILNVMGLMLLDVKRKKAIKSFPKQIRKY
ncbi:hypothetical protein SAMN04489724_1719 [Algoriphagus locisalis]|uniref:NnrS protein n=1 Tax=Algoriphagus locisalis TaxID=305507 RepID=A0A1I7A777_9BACT|nr:hypothetical protein [Algoriphagus locisalis]SFT70710.1 hypothetical protein SAMN04489724_1719 [Algoriphagus locisalis]